ncbi:MAG: hypothetical protein KGL39_38260 [Patescibacteria group bacterium]|nr:hypothetical protein [Patescibacteria group bacterium]
MGFDRPSAAQETELLEEILTFADDPRGFVHFVYPWGEPNTPLANVKGPRRWQEEELEALTDHVKRAAFAHDNGLNYPIFRDAVSSGRGPGKSGLAGMIAHWHISTHLGAHGIIAANTETQLRTKTFPEIAKWVTLGLNRHWFNVDGTKVYPENWLSDLAAKHMQIDSRYWGLFGQTWTEESPDAFAGAHVPYGLMVVFDEAAGIPAAVWNVAEGFFSDPGPYRAWLAMSQMRRASGRFYDLHFDPEFKKQWRSRILDVREIPEIDQAWVQSFIDTHGGDESDEVRVEIRGLPPKLGERQFISPLKVREAMAREIHVFDDDAPLILGVDPAPRGRTVMRFRQGRDGRSFKPVVLIGADNVKIADEIVKLIDRFDPDAVVVDAGMGTGVIDILKRRGVKVHEVWFGSGALDLKEFLTRGTELWAKAREWLDGGCLDPKDDDLFFDMTKREWKWAGREENKIVLESKDDLAARVRPGYSPDDMDAFALTFHVNPPRRGKRARRRVYQGGDEQRGRSIWDQREDLFA